MKHGKSMFEGILRDDEFKARMKMVAARNARLREDFTRRSEVRRGSGAAAVGRGVQARSEYRRHVVVKAKYHDRAKAGRPNMVAAVLNYLEKEGELHDKDGRAVDKETLKVEWEHDRRIFHVFVSPNDGHRFTDAEMVGGPDSVGAQILRRWEARTGPLEAAMAVETKPDAAHPEGNKHIHYAIRGVQDGKDLFIRKEVIAERFREDAEDVVTDRLGYMTERERRELSVQMERHARERELSRGHGIDRAQELELERELERRRAERGLDDGMSE